MTAADVHAVRLQGGRDAGAGAQATNVLIAAENEIVRAGIAALIGLHDECRVAEARPRLTALVEHAQSRRHDVLLVELGEDGAALRGLLQARSEAVMSDVAVVALVTEDLPDPEVLRTLVQQGVDGVVTANDRPPQLIGAVQAVRHGQRWLSPTLGGLLLSVLVRPAPSVSLPAGGAEAGEASLTRREHNVLALVAEGLTVNQIARRLHRSESAVKYHLSNMSARYQASNRAHLVYLAVRAGELQLD